MNSFGGNDAYKRKTDYNPDEIRKKFIKIEDDFKQREADAQKAIDDYKADISCKQEKLQTCISSLEMNLRKIESKIKEAEESFTGFIVDGNVKSAQRIKHDIEALQNGREKTLRELLAFRHALESVRGDERLYKRILDKYEACEAARKDFFRESKSFYAVIEEQRVIWDSFERQLTYGHIALGIHVRGYKEIVQADRQEAADVVQ